MIVKSVHTHHISAEVRDYTCGPTWPLLLTDLSRACFPSGTGWAEHLCHVTWHPYQTLPFWTLCFSSKHFYYFSTFAEFPSLISGKSGEQCVCVWCAHAHSPVSVCICIHVRATNNHICTSSLSPCEMGSCLLLYARPVGLSMSHLLLESLNPGLRVCVTTSVTEP